MILDQDVTIHRIYADVRALAEPRRASAETTKERFKRGYALGPQGFQADYLELVTDQSKVRHYERTGELASATQCLTLAGLMEDGRVTALGAALLPVLRHEGMSSPFVWYVLWINVSCSWLGATAWNMLSRKGATVPLLVEPLCSYLCGENEVSRLDRGAADTLEDSLRHTPWGQLGIGEAPAYGHRLWTRSPPTDVDPLLVLYGVYRAAETSGLLRIDRDRLAALPYGPCMSLGIDGSVAEHALLSLWLPRLLTQQRVGDKVMFSISMDKSGSDVVNEYSRRRGYQ